MEHVSMPLKLSAAGLRVAGFMMERNLRVAQVLGRAAIEANLYFAGVKIKASSAVPNTDAEHALRTRPSEPKAAARPKPLAKAKPKPAAKAKPVAKTEPVAKAHPVTKAATAPKPQSGPKPPEKPAHAAAAPSTVSNVTEFKQKPAVPNATAPAAPLQAAAKPESSEIKRPRQPSPPPSLPDPVSKTIKDGTA